MKKKVLLICAVMAVLVGVSTTTQAGPSKVFGPYFAWDNNFHGSNISWTPGSGSDPTWTASFNFSQDGLYGYPASIRGWHYGFNPAGDNLFPKQVSTISTAPAQFSYTSGGSNMKGDFAYDLFLRSDSAKDKPQLEVMIWAGNNSYPLGNPMVSNAITENGVSYDLWGGFNSSAGYYVYTFLPRRSSVPASLPTGGSANVDLKHFLNILNGKANYSPTMYLDVVEAGCEIVSGNGHVATTWFSVTAR